MSELVSAYVRRVFPNGTIPIGASDDDPRRTLDYRFNYFENFCDSNWEPPDEIKYATFPLWPPDAFACAANLLEQSSAYLRLAYLGEPPKDLTTNSEPGASRKAWPFEADVFLKAGFEPTTTLAVPPDLLKICRVIGALWSHGALFISGDGQFGNGAVPKELIALRACAGCVDNAKHFLKRRYRSEFISGDLNGVFSGAVSWWNDDGKEKALPPLALVHLTKNMSEDLLARLDASKGDNWHHPESKPSDFARVAAWAMYFLTEIWSVLAEANDASISISKEPGAQDWRWWRAVILLLIIADEGGKSIGFSHPDDNSMSDDGVATDQDTATASNSEIEDAVRQGSLPGFPCRSVWLQHSKNIMRERKNLPRTLTQCFDDSICSVLPKARTPPSGCTIRSLSHNLAVIPAKGRVRARWAQQGAAYEHRAYNLLLIPFPYTILSKDISPEPADVANRDQKWGRFSYQPSWTGEKTSGKVAKDSLWDFVAKLIFDQPEGTINGVVFPESALDWTCFEHIAEKIRTEHPSIELLVSGTHSYNDKKLNSKTKDGNFVATYMRQSGSTSSTDWAIKSVRSKHHRWSLNHQQLTAYALSNRLAPDRIWWENIDIPPREMLFAEFSSGSILTTLICEDLARIEPCQAALRAVGPNLTLVLLMDSAQIHGRWPSQYAGVLTDDPGTSVLTLTSFGLVNRSNLSEGYTSRAIAYWREPYAGPARVIDLPVGFHAQLISLRRDYVRETTIDGRGDNGDSAIVWRLAGVVPIKVDGEPPGGMP